MTAVKDDPLLANHAWFTSHVETQGAARVRFNKGEAEIFGTATISLNACLAAKVKLLIEQISPESAHPMASSLHPRFDDLEIDTPDGPFVASRVYYSGYSTGNSENPEHFLLSMYNAELTVSNKKPVYWALPLSNFLSDYLRHADEQRTHPLRINPEQRVIPFTWDGKPAYIEPLLDYERREKMLEGGEERSLLTAIIVGEVGNHPIDAKSISSWFPDTLLWVLGVATGNEIGAPWVEFRDAEGNLVKRVYRHLGAPPLTNGRRIIEEVFGSHTAELLNAVQSTPFCQQPVYRVLLHHALRAAADGQTVDDRLSHLFRALDRLCKEHGFKTVFLRGLLAEPQKANASRVLDQASRDLEVLAGQAQRTGDLDTHKALEKIAQRVKAADQTDRDFGSAVCMLAQQFGFHDETAMDAYLAANPLSSNITTWRSALSEYRNVNTHDAFHDTSDPAHAFDKLYGMNMHLLDLLVRILLVKSGYNGPYHPIAATWVGTQKPLDWVQPSTSAGELGYGNLL